MAEPRIITRAERAARKAAEKQPVKLTGLGDVVALVAQPIARTIDSVAGTKIAECGGCKKRQGAWNKFIPFTIPSRTSESQ